MLHTYHSFLKCMTHGNVSFDLPCFDNLQQEWNIKEFRVLLFSGTDLVNRRIQGLTISGNWWTKRVTDELWQKGNTVLGRQW